MKENIIKLKEWWSGLGLRERKAIGLATIALSVFILYQFVWSPLDEAASALRKEIASSEKNLVWMQNANNEIKKHTQQNKPNEKVSSPVVMLGLLQKEIDHAGLQQYLTQLKQNNNDAIEIHFQKVQFDALMKLLLEVSQKHGAEIIQMSAVTDAPGLVNADILVKVA